MQAPNTEMVRVFRVRGSGFFCSVFRFESSFMITALLGSRTVYLEHRVRKLEAQLGLPARKARFLNLLPSWLTFSTPDTLLRSSLDHQGNGVRRAIDRTEREYSELHQRIQRSLIGRWVRDRSNDRGTIEDVHINTAGVTCTILWSNAGRRTEQKFSRDFMEW